MCQSTVFLRKEGKEKEILKDATLVEPCEGGVRIQGFSMSPGSSRPGSQPQTS